ncbi:MAG: hypothetical protein UY95_C0012G0012 [Parcubacteria group bacterium GW2011_GWA2_56_7]|nr:MAG: hypothetical protein UY95_C0012G0012 [Parcubacteria group bacterium GW2011_GWA2_56_7]
MESGIIGLRQTDNTQIILASSLIEPLTFGGVQATNPYAHHSVIGAQAGALLDGQGGFLGSFEGESLLAIAAYCLIQK